MVLAPEKKKQRDCFSLLKDTAEGEEILLEMTEQCFCADFSPETNVATLRQDSIDATKASMIL